MSVEAVPSSEIASPDTPAPDGDVRQEQLWATEHDSALRQLGIQAPDASTPPEQALQEEATYVDETELDSLLIEDETTSDANFGDDLCALIKALEQAIGNVQDVTAVVNYLQQLSNGGNPSAAGLIAALNDGNQKWTTADPNCVSTIDWVDSLLQLLSAWFCPPEPAP